MLRSNRFDRSGQCMPPSSVSRNEVSTVDLVKMKASESHETYDLLHTHTGTVQPPLNTRSEVTFS